MSNNYINSKGEASTNFMDEDPRSSWISCKVSQPNLQEDGQQLFIVTFEHDSGLRTSSLALWDYDKKEWMTFSKVIAWQLLPSPYKGE